MLEDVGFLVQLASWLACLLNKSEEGFLRFFIHFLQLRVGEKRSVNCHAAFTVTSRKNENFSQGFKEGIVSFVCRVFGRIVHRAILRVDGESGEFLRTKGQFLLGPLRCELASFESPEVKRGGAKGSRRSRVESFWS